MQGCDYSNGRISGAECNKLNIGFVCRYLSSYPAKNLSAEEITDFNAHNVAIVTVWENDAQAALRGYVGGSSDAIMARAELRQLKAPLHAPVFFALDWDVQSSDITAIVGYFEGAIHILGKENVGVYGGYRAVNEILNAGLAQYAWQTAAWSDSIWDQRAAIRQESSGYVTGVEVDWDTSMYPDFGQWRYDLGVIDDMIINGELGYAYAFNAKGEYLDTTAISMVVLETANNGTAQAPASWLSLGCDGDDSITNTVYVRFYSDTGKAWNSQLHVIKPTEPRLSIPVPANTGKIAIGRMGTPPTAGNIDPALENPIGYCVLYARQ